MAEKIQSVTQPTLTIAADQVRAAQELHAAAQGWQAAYALLTSFCSTHSGQDYAPLTQVKVALVNSLYQAGVQAESKMAHHIAEQAARLEPLIEHGAAEAIHLVARPPYTKARLVSFATKYCHFHNPARFPIYDRYAAAALGIPSFDDPIAEWYERYRATMLLAGLSSGESFTFAELDGYLWLKGQKALLASGDVKIEKLSEEVRLLMDTQPAAWSRL